MTSEPEVLIAAAFLEPFFVNIRRGQTAFEVNFDHFQASVGPIVAEFYAVGNLTDFIVGMMQEIVKTAMCGPMDSEHFQRVALFLTAADVADGLEQAGFLRKKDP